MKKSFFSFAILAVCAAVSFSCDKSVEVKAPAPMEFYAVMPGADPDKEADTRTVTEDGKYVLWCEGDKVSIFRGENINDEYVVREGFGGGTTTKLVKVEDGSFNAGNEVKFDANIAWYPFGNVAYCPREENSSEPVYSLKVPIPDVQKYTANSFAPGAFPMVAVSSDKDDNKLAFKNLFGIINIKLKSPNWYYSVKDIVIKGNNNERLSGDALVKCSHSGVPEVEFVEGKSNDYVKLDCGGIELFPGGEEIEFWIALPPLNYEKGLTITMTFNSGKSLEKRTLAIEIKRSVMTPMTVLDVDSEDGELYIPDNNFKNELLRMEKINGVKVDMDGDGLLTAKDLKEWNEYYKDKDAEFYLAMPYDIESLKGIEYFTSLTSLDCTSSKITSLDLSHNTALKKLSCGNEYYPDLVIDISKNTSLTWLDCSYTAMKELDLSKHTELEYLKCGHNKMERLDVSNNTALKTLICYVNELTELDVSKNVALVELNCSNNKLTSVDISKNPVMRELACEGNNLAYINFCDSPVLEELDCMNCQLTELDLSKCALLHSLSCKNNQLTELDVSKTSIGEGSKSYPLFCNMESLKTLYLKTGWKIKGITENRSTTFIHANTEIKYKD